MSSLEVIQIVDPGPILYRELVVFGDPDLEHALHENGYDPVATRYRLLKIPLGSIDMVRSGVWGRMGRHYIDAARAGAAFPPIVVMPGSVAWILLDGVNRTHAFWSLGYAEVTAYELLAADSHD